MDNFIIIYNIQVKIIHKTFIFIYIYIKKLRLIIFMKNLKYFILNYTIQMTTFKDMEIPKIYETNFIT